MSGAFPPADCALITLASSGALAASTAEVFRNERRETCSETEWKGHCILRRKVGASGINGRDKQRVSPPDCSGHSSRATCHRETGLIGLLARDGDPRQDCQGIPFSGMNFDTGWFEICRGREFF